MPVIDSADFLRDPEAYLRWPCAHIGVPFTDAMLRWPAGPRDSDGVWAKYLVRRRRGINRFPALSSAEVSLEGAALAAAEQRREHYERLRAVR